MSNEEYSNHQLSQLTQMTINYSRASEENEKLKKRIDLLVDEKNDISKSLNQTAKELKIVREDFHEERDKLVMLYESKLKQKDFELENRPKMFTASGDTRLTDLGALDLGERDMSLAIPHHQTSHNSENYFLRISNARSGEKKGVEIDGLILATPSKKAQDVNYEYNDAMNEINYLV
jgi:hypothetical protein